MTFLNYSKHGAIMYPKLQIFPVEAKMAKRGRPPKPLKEVEIDEKSRDALMILAYFSINILRESGTGKCCIDNAIQRIEAVSAEVFHHYSKLGSSACLSGPGRKPSVQLIMRHLLIREHVRQGGSIESGHLWLSNAYGRPPEGCEQIYPISMETKHNFWREEKLLAHEIAMVEFFEWALHFLSNNPNG